VPGSSVVLQRSKSNRPGECCLFPNNFGDSAVTPELRLRLRLARIMRESERNLSNHPRNICMVRFRNIFRVGLGTRRGTDRALINKLEHRVFRTRSLVLGE
jgi:hypothetical protein